MALLSFDNRADKNSGQRRVVGVDDRGVVGDVRQRDAHGHPLMLQPRGVVRRGGVCRRHHAEPHQGHLLP